MSQINANSINNRIIPPIDISAPENVETFTCAMGCFWGPDSRFGAMDWVVRTRVGYAGGTTPNPTYHNIADHIETIQIDFDPQKITYEQMLKIFWQNHKPARTVWKRQYAPALFFENEYQEKLARESRAKMASKTNEIIQTEIISLEKFYLAEMYHQKYHLQGYEELMGEYMDIYPDMMDIVNSTSAARVNGYIGGYADLNQLEEEFPLLGLSGEKKVFLNNIIESSRR